MRVLEEHVRGGQLVLDEAVNLLEGAEVRVALVDELNDVERAEACTAGPYARCSLRGRTP